MRQKLKIALQMDPLEKLDLKGDSTFILGLEAIKRGFELYFYSPSDLIYKNNNVYAKAKILDLAFENGKEKFNYGKIKVLKLSSLDVILMRQDPPFNMNYITATHLLEKLQPKVFILNDPMSVRNSPEKLFVTKFNNLMPPTLISSDKKEILRFRNKYKDIIIKPLFGNGGESIIRIDKNDKNFSSLLEMFFKMYSEPLMIQKFIKEVSKGDKRIILLNGEVIGSINRIPAKGEIRANLHVGARAAKGTLSKDEIDICNTISPFLKKQKLYFAGIDVIGGKYLTEINVTSPTGLQEINKFENKKCEVDIWKFIENTISS